MKTPMLMTPYVSFLQYNLLILPFFHPDRYNIPTGVIIVLVTVDNNVLYITIISKLFLRTWQVCFNLTLPVFIGEGLVRPML